MPGGISALPQAGNTSSRAGEPSHRSEGQLLTEHPDPPLDFTVEPLSFAKRTNLPLASLTSLQEGLRKLRNRVSYSLNSEDSRTDRLERIPKK